MSQDLESLVSWGPDTGRGSLAWGLYAWTLGGLIWTRNLGRRLSAV